MSEITKTPLHDEHIKLGARMVSFAGWQMPVQYSSIIEEHKCVRENVGIFDVSHMGEVFVSGKDSLNLLQKIVPQDISKLKERKAVYCQLTNKKGGIIDDLIIYKLKDKNELPHFLLIVNASRINEDLEWINQNAAESNFDVLVDNQSESLSLLAVQGPKAADLINELGETYEDQPEYFSIKSSRICSMDLHISRTGYTGEDGFEIMVPNAKAVQLWNELLLIGEKFNIKPIGLGARDTLRLEAALHLYGQDMDEDTTPVDASLGWSIAKDKQEVYNGKDKIMSQFADNKPSKRLVGFKMIDRAIPRHGYEIYIGGTKAGNVTSGGVSPILQSNIGMGYINTSYPTKVGTLIEIMVRNKLYKAEVVKRPFVAKNSVKIKKK